MTSIADDLPLLLPKLLINEVERVGLIKFLESYWMNIYLGKNITPKTKWLKVLVYCKEP